MCIYIYIYVVYVYIYIERERYRFPPRPGTRPGHAARTRAIEREQCQYMCNMCVYIYIYTYNEYIYIYIHTCNMYIYIYIHTIYIYIYIYTHVIYIYIHIFNACYFQSRNVGEGGNHLSNATCLAQVFFKHWRIRLQIVVIIDTTNNA